jgi:hypothetical protein
LTNGRALRVVLLFLEIALVFVRLDHVANANGFEIKSYG